MAPIEMTRHLPTTITHLSIAYQHPQGICHVRSRVVLHQNFLAYTKVDRTSRIIKLIVSHRSYQLRHTSQQSLAGRANAWLQASHDKQIITSETFTALLLMAVASTMLTVPMVSPRLAQLKALITRSA